MKEISKDIPGDKVKLVKNAPPVPSNVKLVFDETDKPLHIIFQYECNRSDGKEIMEWIRQYSHGFCTGYRFTKEQLVFDGEFDVEGYPLHIYNMLAKDTVFDDIFVNIEMSYEHFYWDL